MTERQHPDLKDFSLSQFEAAPPPPQKDLNELKENETFNRKTSRRNFLKGVGIATLASSPVTLGIGGIYLDQVTSERKQSEEIGVGFLNREAMYGHADTAILTLPGFNVYEGFNVAKDITDGTKSFAQVAGLRYGNKEFNIPAILRSAKDFIAQYSIKKLHLYGHSMGGLVALELAGDIKESMEDVEVGNIFLDCSPIGDKSIRHLDDEVMLLVQLLNKLSVYGGTRTSYAIEVAINYIERDQALKECLENAKRKLSNKNCSNRMAVQQLAYMSWHGAAQLLANLPEHANINYICPEDPHGDSVIDNSTAWQNLQLYSHNQTRRVKLPDIGHANPGGHKELYADALQKVFALTA